jgi:hypothetical protein
MKKQNNTQNKTNKITELLQKIFLTQVKTDNKIQTLNLKTTHELKNIQVQLKSHNKLLKEHHDRSVQLKRDNDIKEKRIKLELEKHRKEVDTRLYKLEVPHKWLEYTKTALLWTASILGAIIGIKQAIVLLLK